MAPVVDKYLIGHSVCVKSLHGTNVLTSWSFVSGSSLDSRVIAFWERAAHWLTVSSIMSISILVVSHFGVESGTVVVIASVPVTAYLLLFDRVCFTKSSNITGINRNKYGAVQASKPKF